VNYCPDCGSEVEFKYTNNDVAVFRAYFHCTKCGADWCETVEKGVEERVLFINPVREGGN